MDRRQKWVEKWELGSSRTDNEVFEGPSETLTSLKPNGEENPWAALLAPNEGIKPTKQKAQIEEKTLHAKEETAFSNGINRTKLNPKADMFTPQKDQDLQTCKVSSAGRTGLEKSRWASHKPPFTAANSFDCFEVLREQPTTRLREVEYLSEANKSEVSKQSVSNQAKSLSSINLLSISGPARSSHASPGVLSFAVVSDMGIVHDDNVKDSNTDSVVDSLDPRGRESHGSNQDWNETRRPKRQRSPGPHELTGFRLNPRQQKDIEKWVERLALPAQPDILQRGLYGDYDFDHKRGEMVARLPQPPTQPYPYRTPPRVRILFTCSDDAVKVQCEEMRVREGKRARKLERERARQAEAELQREDELRERENREKWGPKLSAHFRPATEEDMGAVAELYNREARLTCKVSDLEPVDEKVFKTLAKWALEDDMPFLVAVPGPYVGCGRGSSSGSDIIGFAFVDKPRGVSGSLRTTECYTGKIRVIVHPEFRRKRIASCLLDIVVGFFSLNYTSHRHYEFVNPTSDPRFDPTRLSNKLGKVHKLRYIDIEFGIKAASRQEDVEKSEEYSGLKENMALYSFRLVRHDIKYYHCPHVARKGTEAWMDRLVFTHECRDWNTMRYE